MPGWIPFTLGAPQGSVSCLTNRDALERPSTEWSRGPPLKADKVENHETQGARRGIVRRRNHGSLITPSTDPDKREFPPLPISARLVERKD